MSKALLVSNGPNFMLAKARKEFLKYFDEVKMIGEAFSPVYKYEEFDSKEFVENFITMNPTNIKEIAECVKNCDFIFSLEHSSALFVVERTKAYNKIISAIQVLDFPIHVFSTAKDYNERQLNNWNQWANLLIEIKVIFYNHKDSMDYLAERCSNSINKFLRYPVLTMDIRQFERKDYILFVGRISPDKGVNYIIDALSILSYNLPLKIITTGAQEDKALLTKYAKYLNVDCEIISNCSEKQKWQMYHECRFTVCGADNFHISGLCPLEGISVGRLGIVFDTPENRLHYDRFAMYCIMRDIGSLSRAIDTMWKNSKIADDHAKDGVEWCKENCSIEQWAKNIYITYEEIIGRKKDVQN